MTKHALLMIVLQLAASGGDAWTTHRGIALGAPERNPIARPFVRSTTGQVAFFGGGAALKIAVPFVLRRKSHPHAAMFAEWAGIADSGAAFGNNVAALERRKR